MGLKDIKDQTYYEILEISVTATSKEIQRAYEQARETFHADSIAIYSLFSEEEVKEIEEAADEAYRVLMDEESRKHYDQTHSRDRREQTPEKPLETPVPVIERRVPLSFTDLSLHAKMEHYRGRELKQLREGMGFELQAVSKETRISLKVLECLEEENFEGLPVLVYVKGFLKNYAQFLGLDPQKVVEGYLQSMEESKKK